MKLTADNLENFKPITAPTDIAGVPYESVKSIMALRSSDKVDDQMAAVLVAPVPRRTQDDRTSVRSFNHSADYADVCIIRALPRLLLMMRFRLLLLIIALPLLAQSSITIALDGTGDFRVMGWPDAAKLSASQWPQIFSVQSGRA